jgi:hypothetical protein
MVPANPKPIDPIEPETGLPGSALPKNAAAFAYRMNLRKVLHFMQDLRRLRVRERGDRSS